MGSERRESEGQTVFDMPGGEGADAEEVHGDDPGLDADAIDDQLASSVVGARNAYIPVESLRHQATALMVYGKRVDGPIGALLRVAAESISVAIQMHVAEHGPVAEGPAPNYREEVPDLDIEVL